MLILALDTTSRAGSVALARGDDLLELHIGDPDVPHGTRLPGDILQVLQRRNVSIGAVDVFGIAAGPGSFTGLRVGIATVQGLALATRRPVVAVSSLAAVAYAAALAPGRGGEPDMIAALVDAERHEIFSALYRRRAAAAGSETPAPSSRTGVISTPPGFDEILGPIVASPTETTARLVAVVDPTKVLLGGSGLIRYRDRLLEELPPGVRTLDEVPALAAAIARMAAIAAADGRAISPHGVKPVYVRRPDAELARDRRAALEE